MIEKKNLNEDAIENKTKFEKWSKKNKKWNQKKNNLKDRYENVEGYTHISRKKEKRKKKKEKDVINTSEIQQLHMPYME